eukprot:869062_1
MSGSLRRSSRIKNQQKARPPQLQPIWKIGHILNGIIPIELSNGHQFEDHPLDTLDDIEHQYKFSVIYQIKKHENGNWSDAKTKPYNFPPKIEKIMFYLKATPGVHLQFSIPMNYKTKTFKAKPTVIAVPAIQTKSTFEPYEIVHYHA